MTATDLTEITIELNHDGPVTGEHPICGDTFTADTADTQQQQVHEASCWAAGHAHCGCLRFREITR